MKRVCFFVGNLNLGAGTERVTTDIANALSENGFDISILSLYEGNQPFFDLNKTIQTASLFPKRVSFSRNYVKTIKSLRNFIRDKDFDILIDVDSILAIYSIPALLGRKKIKHIVWEHFNFNIDLGIKSRRIARQLSGIFADTIIVLTESDKKLWEKGIYYKGAKIIKISNPCSFPPNDYLPSKEQKIFISIGRLTHQKGYDLLIEAWEKAATKIGSNWKLWIVGSGEEQESLNYLIREKKIEETVFFFPHTNKVEEYYQKASFFCLSSRFEGQGLVLLEAQNFGIPAIAFDCKCGPSEIITNNQNGYITKELDTNEFALALEKAAGMTESEYKLMSFKSKENARRFRIELIIKEWNNLLK